MYFGNLIADRDIPFLEGVLDDWFDVRRLPGREIGPDDVRDASALLVRTRTRCNASLLEGSAVRLVATATIGTDHIDMRYCAKHGITVASAPGCNAAAVAQYVGAALHALSLDRQGATLGVIGVGHVGSLVAEVGRRAGMRVLLSDPPREAAEGPAGFTPLPELLAASDIVTLHIPLWPENRDFADAAFFSQMRPGASFFNASRGEVVDEDALLAARQGKINGTQAVVRAVGETFGIDPLRQFSVTGVSLPQEPYDIFRDDAALRRDPSAFESLRSHYAYRNDQLKTLS